MSDLIVSLVPVGIVTLTGAIGIGKILANQKNIKKEIDGRQTTAHCEQAHSGLDREREIQSEGLTRELNVIQKTLSRIEGKVNG